FTKVKNHRSAALQNICSSIWKVFGHKRLPPLKSTASATEIIRWKESLQVNDCYRALFEQNSKGNDFDNGGSNHNSAEEIIDSELAGRPAAETARQSSSEPEPESEPVLVYRRSSSMMSIEELDELFG
ncbi:8690_t:CDS:2, partial [Gigaspora rosea]